MNRFFITILIFGFSQTLLAQEEQGTVLYVKGKGTTTGHIADLGYKNDSDYTLVFKSQDFFISSKGKYQSYVGHINEGITVPPFGQITIEIHGFCTDVTKPPIPNEHDFPPLNEWIPVETDIASQENLWAIGDSAIMVSLIPTNPLPSFSEFDIRLIEASSSYSKKSLDTKEEYVLTYPGTNQIIRGTIDPEKDPKLIAPLMVSIVSNIEKAALVVLQDENYDTPFSNNPEKEEPSVIQQVVWMVTAPLAGETYTKEDFEVKVIEQFKETTGQNVAQMEEEKKENIVIGIKDLWAAFVATGVEAKVIKERSNPSEKDAPDPSMTTTETLTNCTLDSLIKDSGKNLDYQIANTGTKEANEEVMKGFESAIEEAAGIINDQRDVDSIDIRFSTPELPASVWSLYFPHTIAGRANASAFIVDLNNPHKSAWTTKPIKSKTKGEHILILTHNTGKDCISTLYGLNVAKLKASSKMKEQLTSIDELKVVNFVGEVAIDYLINRGKGKAKKLGKYLKDKVKDLAKSKAKETIKEELKKIGDMIEGKSEEEADEIIDKLTKDIKTGKEEEEDEDFLEEWLAELIVEGEEINPGEKMISDQLDKIDSPIDWSPIKTNTYAMVEGNLKVYVEDNNDLAKVASAVRYKRKELEKSEEAVKGGGVFVEEAMASATTSNQITLKTQGKSEAYAGATGEGIIDTGHGMAEAVLESFNAMYVVAVCKCPHYTWHDTYYSSTLYTENEIMSAIWTKMFDTMLGKVTEKYMKEGKEDELLEALEKEATKAISIIMRYN